MRARDCIVVESFTTITHIRHSTIRLLQLYIYSCSLGTHEQLGFKGGSIGCFFGGFFFTTGSRSCVHSVFSAHEFASTNYLQVRFRHTQKQSNVRTTCEAFLGTRVVWLDLSVKCNVRTYSTCFGTYTLGGKPTFPYSEGSREVLVLYLISLNPGGGFFSITSRRLMTQCSVCS